MLVDTRLNPNYNNNQAIIICIVHFRYYMLNLLLKDARIQPHDQNNLAIRLSLLKRDKKLVDMLLCHQAVVHQIYTDPQLLNYIIGYQNNGNQFI
jgi:formate-dependent nitrite reductase membrane component NrfD